MAKSHNNLDEYLNQMDLGSCYKETLPYTETHLNINRFASIYDFCYLYLSVRSLISIEYVTSNDKLFEGTVQELLDTIDADLRTICSTTKIYRIVPELSLRKGTPLSICLLI